jgi:hypothetical protein
LGANIFFSLPSLAHQEPVRVTPSNSDYESRLSDEDDYPAHNGYVHYYDSRVHEEAVQPQQDPLPYQQSPLPVVHQQVQSLITSPLVDFPAIAPYIFPQVQNQILDEAVDELFFLSQPENDQIMDFVNAWCPASFGGDGALTDDVQLGNILDKILEE